MINVPFEMHLTFHVLVETLAMAYISFEMCLTLAMVYIFIKMHMAFYILFGTLVMAYILVRLCMAPHMFFGYNLHFHHNAFDPSCSFWNLGYGLYSL
jgi:hypothetical protein